MICPPVPEKKPFAITLDETLHGQMSGLAMTDKIDVHI